MFVNIEIQSTLLLLINLFINKSQSLRSPELSNGRSLYRAYRTQNIPPLYSHRGFSDRFSPNEFNFNPQVLNFKQRSESCSGKCERLSDCGLECHCHPSPVGTTGVCVGSGMKRLLEKVGVDESEYCSGGCKTDPDCGRGCNCQKETSETRGTCG